MGQTAKKITDSKLAIVKVSVKKDLISAEISDGRIVSIPIAWFPRLEKATAQQRQKFQISPSGYGVHWPEVDEDISIKAFLK